MAERSVKRSTKLSDPHPVRLYCPGCWAPSADRFVNRLSDRDQMQLELANDSVHSSTEKVSEGTTTNGDGKRRRFLFLTSRCVRALISWKRDANIRPQHKDCSHVVVGRRVFNLRLPASSPKYGTPLCTKSLRQLHTPKQPRFNKSHEPIVGQRGHQQRPCPTGRVGRNSSGGGGEEAGRRPWRGRGR